MFGPFGMIYNFDSTDLILPKLNDLLLIIISGVVEGLLLYFLAKAF